MPKYSRGTGGDPSQGSKGLAAGAGAVRSGAAEEIAWAVPAAGGAALGEVFPVSGAGPVDDDEPQPAARAAAKKRAEEAKSPHRVKAVIVRTSSTLSASAAGRHCL
jgi:hypothetical protein